MSYYNDCYWCDADLPKWYTNREQAICSDCKKTLKRVKDPVALKMLARLIDTRTSDIRVNQTRMY